MNGKVYLHELRRNRDFALGEVARGIGITAPVLSRIERGKIPLDDAVCGNLAIFLNVTETEIREGVPDAAEVAQDQSRMLDTITALAAVQAEAKSGSGLL